MWTAVTRAQHRRDRLRFASDLTDAEWLVVESLLPPPSAGGRPPEWPMREIVNATFYVLHGGIRWRMLPPCFSPSTDHRWMVRGMAPCGGVANHRAPSRHARPREGRPRRQSGGARGFDAGKKVVGQKRHAMVDTDGRLLCVQVHPLSIQDRDGAVPQGGAAAVDPDSGASRRGSTRRSRAARSRRPAASSRHGAGRTRRRSWK